MRKAPGTMVPLRSVTGQNLMCCPQGSAQPFETSTEWSLRAGSVHSPPALKPKTPGLVPPVGVNEPATNALVVPLVMRGSTDCDQNPAAVEIVLRLELAPWAYQRTLASPPKPWY